MTVLFGAKDGTFGNPVDLAASGVQSVAIADVDLDGLNDIVSLTDSYPNAINVNLHQSQRTFANSFTAMSARINNFATGDLNGDKLPDLVATTWVANGDSPQSLGIAVALGTGSGSFASPVVCQQGYAYADQINLVKIADMNGDGKLDVVVGGYYTSTVSVLLGRGDGSLENRQDYSIYGDPNASCQAIMIDDVNGDGRLDVVAVGNWGTISVLFGKADGTLANAVGNGSIPTSSEPIAIGDLNGDGWPDVAGVDPNSCELSVLFGRCRQ
jgi:hypothetical protein